MSIPYATETGKQEESWRKAVFKFELLRFEYEIPEVEIKETNEKKHRENDMQGCARIIVHLNLLQTKYVTCYSECCLLMLML